MKPRILILGGTTQSRKLAVQLVDSGRFDVVSSIAGRTRKPKAIAGTVRIGGFGGADGLAIYLQSGSFDVVIDATHPFATTISRNAVIAAESCKMQVVRLNRPEWQRVEGDQWIEVVDLDSAVKSLPAKPSRIFLSVGRQSLEPFAKAPQHHYVIRVIDPPTIPPEIVNYEIVKAVGPFTVEEDLCLLDRQKIDIVVTKNSGGSASYGKIAAANLLGKPVIMIKRPQPAPIPKNALYVEFNTVDQVLQWLQTHFAVLTKRSV